MHFIIYTKSSCTFCELAKDKLDDLGHTYSEQNVSNEQNLEDLRFLIPDVKTVPQIFILEDENIGEHIGGYQDLVEYFKEKDNE